jgi:ABC-type transporter Mla subunit MlaD
MDRKTQRELARLSQEAKRLWDEQRDVLSHAKSVARHASASASDIAKRDLIPRAHETYRDTIEPALARIPWRTVTAPKKTSNPVGYVLMAIGAIAVALIGYAAWQTLRADDDLWVEDED